MILSKPVGFSSASFQLFFKVFIPDFAFRPASFDTPVHFCTFTGQNFIVTPTDILKALIVARQKFITFNVTSFNGLFSSLKCLFRPCNPSFMHFVTVCFARCGVFLFRSMLIQTGCFSLLPTGRRPFHGRSYFPYIVSDKLFFL